MNIYQKLPSTTELLNKYGQSLIIIEPDTACEASLCLLLILHHRFTLHVGNFCLLVHNLLLLTVQRKKEKKQVCKTGFSFWRNLFAEVSVVLSLLQMLCCVILSKGVIVVGQGELRNDKWPLWVKNAVGQQQKWLNWLPSPAPDCANIFYGIFPHSVPACCHLPVWHSNFHFVQAKFPMNIPASWNWVFELWNLDSPPSFGVSWLWMLVMPLNLNIGQVDV